MGNPIDDLKQQAIQQGKQAAKNAIKQALKSAGKAIWSVIVAYLPWILLVLAIFIVIIGCIDWDETGLIADASGMENATISSSSDEQLVKYIRLMEGGGTVYTVNGKECYKVLSDGSATGSAVGYGVDIGVHGAELRAMGYDTSIGSYIPVSAVDAIEKKVRESFKSQIESYLGNIKLKGYQMCALISRAYNCGVGGGMEGYTDITFVEAYKKYWNQTKDDKYGKTQADFTHKLYTEFMKVPTMSEGQELPGLVKRRESEWTLFQCGYYTWDTRMNELYIEGSSSSNLAEFALQFVGENHTRFTNYSGMKADWCAMFVSYCCDKCGLIPDKISSYTSCGYIADLYEAGNSRVKIVGNKGYFYNKPKNKYTPKSGDIIFFNYDGSGAQQSSHTGIVTDCDGTYVYTVEGNTGTYSWDTSTVTTRKYLLTDHQIVGYISL